MIQIILNLLPMISTIFGYYVTGKANRKELDKAIFNFWRNRSITNEAAAEREDILKQRERIEQIVKEETNNDDTKK